MTEPALAAGVPEVRLLRGFGLMVNGAPVPLTPASERLVAFLAMQARPVRRSFVSGSLWPEATTERANANLRSALWRVPIVDRKPLVDAMPSHLGLRPGIRVDFHTAVTCARSLVHSGDAEISADTLTLLDGELLPDWYEDWIVIERERYRQLRLHAMDQACACLIRRGRYGEAMLVAMGEIAADPLRESGFRFAVEIHLAEGNLIEAVHQYRTYAARLRDELGARPSSQLRRLFDDAGVAT